jgi:uncharacterized membrane protein
VDRTVEGYLAQLRQQLAGADPAVVQDAVYDAEEYLRSALADHGDAPEAFDRVVETYGAPEEVAAAYLETERTVTQALRPVVPRERQRSLPATVFGGVVDPGAWGALFYMLLAFVTGIIYFTVVVTGLSLSFGLLITLLGIPIALLFIAVVRSVSLAEGRLVEGLLGVRMPRRPRTVGARGDIWTRLKSWFADYRTWTTMLYMLLQLPLGTTYFTLLMTGFATSASLIAFPFAQELAGVPILSVEGSMYVMEPWAYPLSVAAGIAGLIVMLWTAKGIGVLHGAYAKAMLVGGFVDQSGSETTSVSGS